MAFSGLVSFTFEEIIRLYQVSLKIATSRLCGIPQVIHRSHFTYRPTSKDGIQYCVIMFELIYLSFISSKSTTQVQESLPATKVPSEFSHPQTPELGSLIQSAPTPLLSPLSSQKKVQQSESTSVISALVGTVQLYALQVP